MPAPRTSRRSFRKDNRPYASLQHNICLPSAAPSPADSHIRTRTLFQAQLGGLRCASEQPPSRSLSQHEAHQSEAPSGVQSRGGSRSIKESLSSTRERFCAPFLRVLPAPRLLSAEVPLPWPITTSTLALLASHQHVPTRIPATNFILICAPETAAIVPRRRPLNIVRRETFTLHPLLSRVLSEPIRADKCNGTITTSIAGRAFAKVQVVRVQEYRTVHQDQDLELKS